jgi:putative hydrolase of the HAD superfamily
MTAKNLIFDADDTLWENNVYFIEATEAFLDIVEAGRLDREEARRSLTNAEHGFIAEHGYGTAGFTACLVHTARELLPEISPDALMQVESLGQAIIARDPIELLPGVDEALQHLRANNRLFLLTKGDSEEQRDKVTRSRLAHYFEHVEVVLEKNVEAYVNFVERLGLDPARTWMIGNSPRSDINPALAAGLNAVHIPHPQTWEMELEEIEDPRSDRLSVVQSVTELISLFSGEPV